MKQLIYIFLFISTSLLAQNSLDDLDVIYQNDFEQNTLGDYQYSEFIEDWNYPAWNTRQATVDIVQNLEDEDDTTKVLKAYYPEESLGSSEGGFQWWTDLDEGYDEVYFSYDVYFMPGFQYQLGGKLPGLMAGNPYYVAPNDGTVYCSSIIMFKQAGQPVFYCDYTDKKSSGENLDSYFWGSVYSEGYWEPSQLEIEYPTTTIDKPYIISGEWHNVTYRTVLNTVDEGVGDANGILEGYFDGELFMQISHMIWRHDEDLQIDQIKFYTFFGGNNDDWRNPIAEWVQFDNVILYTYDVDSVEVPSGNTLSPTDRTINYWRNFGEEEEESTSSFDSVKINFIYNTDIFQSIGNWNNLETRSLGTTHADLIDSDGDATEIDLYVNSTPVYGSASGYYPGLYPDSVVRSSWRTSSTVGAIQLQDLDTDKTYKFEIFGSYNTSSEYLNEYTISDTAKQLDVYDNDETTLSWIINPSSSDLDITFESITGSYGFLNSLVIIDLTEEAGETANADTLYVADTLFASQIDSFYLCELQIINGDTCVGYLDSLNYFIFDTVNFSNVGVNTLLTRYIAYPDYLGQFYMTIDSIDGDTIADYTTISTGGWYTFGFMRINLLQTVTGVHDLYVHCNQYAAGDIHWLLFYYGVYLKHFILNGVQQKPLLEATEQKIYQNK